MSAGTDGIVSWTCTRIQMIDALAALPLGGYLNLEARGRFADCILGQLPEAPPRTDEHVRRILSAVFACGSEDCPKPFALYRSQDVTGVSGSGTVAHGVQFADETVVLRWLGEFASTVVWDSLDAAMKVHGHDGKTRVVWLAAEFTEMAMAEDEAAVAEQARIADMADRLGATIPVTGGTAPFGEIIRETTPIQAGDPR